MMFSSSLLVCTTHLLCKVQHASFWRSSNWCQRINSNELYSKAYQSVCVQRKEIKIARSRESWGQMNLANLVHQTSIFMTNQNCINNVRIQYFPEKLPKVRIFPRKAESRCLQTECLQVNQSPVNSLAWFEMRTDLGPLHWF